MPPGLREVQRSSSCPQLSNTAASSFLIVHHLLVLILLLSLSRFDRQYRVSSPLARLTKYSSCVPCVFRAAKAVCSRCVYVAMKRPREELAAAQHRYSIGVPPVRRKRPFPDPPRCFLILDVVARFQSYAIHVPLFARVFYKYTCTSIVSVNSCTRVCTCARI